MKSTLYILSKSVFLRPIRLKGLLRFEFLIICFLLAPCSRASAQTSAQTSAPSQHNLTATVSLEDLTWPELVEKIKEGFTTVIVPTGGTEQSGPHMTLGKHNFIVQHSALRIAGDVQRVLVAPVLPFVPEGELDKPSGNFLYPGTINISEDTFAKTLIDVCTSLHLSGFKLIVLMADHGQSMPIQELVAQNLTQAWKPMGVRVVNLSAYYDARLEAAVLKRAGIAQGDWGDHAGVADTSELWFVRPQALRISQLKTDKVQGYKDAGASGKPERSSSELGREMMDLRVRAGAQQLEAFIKGVN
jgi:creatinine amidohydrolase/Fe(II)-dependent formamide hydrolase-like protein